MPRPKSLISTKIQVDAAKRAHNCQHIPSHRIEKGDRRLKIPKGRSFEHYCVKCAQRVVQRDIEKLRELERQLAG